MVTSAHRLFGTTSPLRATATPRGDSHQAATRSATVARPCASHGTPFTSAVIGPERRAARWRTHVRWCTDGPPARLPGPWNRSGRKSSKGDGVGARAPLGRLHQPEHLFGRDRGQKDAVAVVTGGDDQATEAGVPPRWGRCRGTRGAGPWPTRKLVVVERGDEAAGVAEKVADRAGLDGRGRSPALRRWPRPPGTRRRAAPRSSCGRARAHGRSVAGGVSADRPGGGG